MENIIEKYIIFPDGKASFRISNTDYSPQMGEDIEWAGERGIVRSIKTTIKESSHISNPTKPIYTITTWYYLRKA
jgi:hypothetical protein